jgi:hypothetical protein
LSQPGERGVRGVLLARDDVFALVGPGGFGFDDLDDCGDFAGIGGIVPQARRV